MNKKYIIFLPIILLIILTIYIFTRQSVSSPSTEPLVGNDADEHGCIGSAGYVWCEVLQKCLRPWEEPCYVEISDEQMIKDALIAKHDWSGENIKITIAKNDGQYATGGVGSETPEAGGGIWFAAKVDSAWQIVFNGNGIISCDDLIDYPDYPTELIPECYDSSTGKVQTR